MFGLVDNKKKLCSKNRLRKNKIPRVTFLLHFTRQRHQMQTMSDDNQNQNLDQLNESVTTGKRKRGSSNPEDRKEKNRISAKKSRDTQKKRTDNLEIYLETSTTFFNCLFDCIDTSLLPDNVRKLHKAMMGARLQCEKDKINKEKTAKRPRKETDCTLLEKSDWYSKEMNASLTNELEEIFSL